MKTFLADIHEPENRVLPNANVDEIMRVCRVCEYRHNHDYENDYLALPRPQHNLAVLMCGECDLFVHTSEGDYTEHMTEGDVFFIPKGTTYKSKWKVSAALSAHITLHFDFMPALDPFEGLSVRAGVLRGAMSKEVTPDIVTLGLLLGQENEGLATLAQLYMTLARSSKYMVCTPRSLPPDDIRPAIDYLRANFAGEFSVGDLAEMCYMSESRFYSRFKATTGTTPVEYRTRLCVRAAERELISTDLSVEQISDRAGFSTAIYFRRIFRKYTGLTPTEYRAQKRGL